MLIGIHQPNYLPGLSYFVKLMRSDAFIFLDSVQFSKGNWTNRNRIKTPAGELLLTVPILTKGQGPQLIKDIRINPAMDWQKKHLKSMEQSYRKSPGLQETLDLLTGIYSREAELLAPLNMALIRAICAWLGIERPMYLASQLGGDGLASTDLLVHLLKAVGGTGYLSGAGGHKYMDMDKFAAAGIEAAFMEFLAAPYRQPYWEFIPNLSIIDLMCAEGRGARAVLEQSWGPAE